MWSRVDGPLPNGVTTDGGLLNIVNAQLYHGGPYVCNVTNKVGSVQSEIVVLVQGSYILLKYITLLLCSNRNRSKNDIIDLFSEIYCIVVTPPSTILRILRFLKQLTQKMNV